MPEGVNASSLKKVHIEVLPYFIPRREYEDLLKKVDFILFTKNNEIIYKASGILADSLSFEIPFIAPRLGYFKEFEDCGIFYDLHDQEQAVSKALQISEREYTSFQKKIKEKIKEYSHKNQKTLTPLCVEY